MLGTTEVWGALGAGATGVVSGALGATGVVTGALGAGATEVVSGALGAGATGVVSGLGAGATGVVSGALGAGVEVTLSSGQTVVPTEMVVVVLRAGQLVTSGGQEVMVISLVE